MLLSDLSSAEIRRVIARKRGSVKNKSEADKIRLGKLIRQNKRLELKWDALHQCYAAPPGGKFETFMVFCEDSKDDSQRAG